MTARVRAENVLGDGFALTIRREVYEQHKDRLHISGCEQANEGLQDSGYVWIAFPAGTLFEEIEKGVRFALPNGMSFCVNVTDAYARRTIFAWEVSTSKSGKGLGKRDLSSTC